MALSDLRELLVALQETEQELRLLEQNVAHADYVIWNTVYDLRALFPKPVEVKPHAHRRAATSS